MTKPKFSRKARRGWTGGHFHHLRTGCQFFREGFASDAGLDPVRTQKQILPGMSECWDECSEQITIEHQRRFPNKLPWYGRVVLGLEGGDDA